MKKSLLKIGFVLMFSLVLGGCQSNNVQPAASPVTQQGQPVPNVPFSRGPTTAPGVKGPTQPFPGGEGTTSLTQSQQEQPQALTETVDKKFTLN